MRSRIDLSPRPEWSPTPRERTETPPPCKKSCCWSPFGHSTARDHLPKWHKDACHCHTPEPEKENQT